MTYGSIQARCKYRCKYQNNLRLQAIAIRVIKSVDVDTDDDVIVYLFQLFDSALHHNLAAWHQQGLTGAWVWCPGVLLMIVLSYGSKSIKAEQASPILKPRISCLLDPLSINNYSTVRLNSY